MLSQLLTRAGIAVSVAGHVLFLVWVIFFAGSRPFEPHTVEAIAVEIVKPEDVPQPAKEEPKPEEEKPKPPEEFRLPEITDKAKPPEDKPAEAKPPEPSTKEASKPPPAAAPPPPAAAAPPPPPPPPQTQAAPAQPPAQQQSAAPAPPPPQQAPQAQTPQPVAAQPPPQAVPRAEPDITERFGMMFTMPGSGAGDFDAEANKAADVSTNVIAALRAHLKTCTSLPKDIARTDNIQIVLRVAFTPEGRLATEPMLIKGPRPSPKVLALLQGAMSGLQACQPYTMLPADKYNEWRSVDLTFSPKDFGGG